MLGNASSLAVSSSSLDGTLIAQHPIDAYYDPCWTAASSPEVIDDLMLSPTPSPPPYDSTLSRPPAYMDIDNSPPCPHEVTFDKYGIPLLQSPALVARLNARNDQLPRLLYTSILPSTSLGHHLFTRAVEASSDSSINHNDLKPRTFHLKRYQTYEWNRRWAFYGASSCNNLNRKRARPTNEGVRDGDLTSRRMKISGRKRQATGTGVSRLGGKESEATWIVPERRVDTPSIVIDSSESSSKAGGNVQESTSAGTKGRRPQPPPLRILTSKPLSAITTLSVTSPVISQAQSPTGLEDDAMCITPKPNTLFKVAASTLSPGGIDNEKTPTRNTYATAALSPTHSDLMAITPTLPIPPYLPASDPDPTSESDDTHPPAYTTLSSTKEHEDEPHPLSSSDPCDTLSPPRTPRLTPTYCPSDPPRYSLCDELVGDPNQLVPSRSHVRLVCGVRSGNPFYACPCLERERAMGDGAGSVDVKGKDDKYDEKEAKEEEEEEEKGIEKKSELEIEMVDTVMELSS